jgi:hypothetical protein
MQEQLAGFGAGLGLEANTKPSVLLIGALIIAGGDSISKDEEARILATSRVEPVQQMLVLIVEHGKEALLRDIAGASAIDVVANDLVVGRNRFRDRA